MVFVLCSLAEIALKNQRILFFISCLFRWIFCHFFICFLFLLFRIFYTAVQPPRVYIAFPAFLISTYFIKSIYYYISFFDLQVSTLFFAFFFLLTSTTTRLCCNYGKRHISVIYSSNFLDFIIQFYSYQHTYPTIPILIS